MIVYYYSEGFDSVERAELGNSDRVIDNFRQLRDDELKNRFEHYAFLIKSGDAPDCIIVVREIDDIVRARKYANDTGAKKVTWIAFTKASK